VAVKAVFFDAGETLVDETRLWASVAAARIDSLAQLPEVLGGL
jgi:hypothetical protein